MSSTKTVTQTKKVAAYGFKLLAGEPDGTFEAIVSVFNNVDFANERVIDTAFDASLERWKASGDPIPVIFSHQWDNLDAHVGIAVEAKALRAGDPRLPTELAGLGGLYIKARLSLDEPFAARLWGKMKSRAIREFSFAYDVLKARPGADGALDLTELDVIEVGPTLKGMNPLTELMDVKGAKAPADAFAALDEADAILTDLELEAAIRGAAARTAGDAKASNLPTLPGSIEEYRDGIAAAADVWAQLEYGRDLYKCHLDATFPAESRCLVTAERWEDPFGEGPIWQLNYSRTADGLVNIDNATPMELAVSLVPKSRADALKDFARASAKLRGAKQAGDEVDETPAELVAAIDATLDDAIEALDAGDTDTARAVLTAVDVTVDELMDAMGVPDPDETVDDGADPASPMPAMPAMPMMGARSASSTRRDRRAGTVPTQGKATEDRPGGKEADDHGQNGMRPGAFLTELEAASLGIDLHPTGGTP